MVGHMNGRKMVQIAKNIFGWTFEIPFEFGFDSPQKLIFLRFWHLTSLVPRWIWSTIEQNVSLLTRFSRSKSSSRARSWINTFSTSGFNLKLERFYSITHLWSSWFGQFYWTFNRIFRQTYIFFELPSKWNSLMRDCLSWLNGVHSIVLSKITIVPN